MSNYFKEYWKQYQDKGMKVAPCKYGAQSTLKAKLDIHSDSKWTEESAIDAITLKGSEVESTNIDLVLGKPSGIIALDIDIPMSYEDTDTSTKKKVWELIKDYVEPVLDSSPVHKVGSKGVTAFFRYIGNFNKKEVISVGSDVILEVLTNKNKTTIPPSLHPTNGVGNYRWTKKELLDIDVNELPVLPPHLLSVIQSVLITNGYGEKSNKYGKIVTGRNQSLSKHLGTLIENRDLTVDGIILKLIQYDKDNHEIAYFSDVTEHGHTDAFTTALAFYSSHMNSINMRRFDSNKEYLSPNMAVIKDISEIKEITVKKLQRQADPRHVNMTEFLRVPSALKSVVQTINQNSWIEQPNLAMSAALCLFSILSARKFTFEDLAFNLYTLNVSPSGSGKMAALDFVRQLMLDNNYMSHLGSGDYVSTASLMDSLSTKSCRLDIMDEMGGKLKTINHSNSEYSAKMADVLAELYTSSNSYFMGRELASPDGGRKVRGQVDKPFVTILGATTPTGISEGISRESIEKGLMGRFIMFFGNANNPSKRVSEKAELDQDVKDHINKLWEFNYGKLDEAALDSKFRDTYEIRTSEEADRMLEDIIVEFDELRLSKIGTVEAPIAARLYQQMKKLVGIHCISRDFNRVPEINRDDVLFGYEVIKQYYRQLSMITESYLFNSPTEKDKVFIKNVVRGKDIADKGYIIKNTPHLIGSRRDKLLEDLVNGGELLQATERATDGGYTTVYMYNYE